ncbi:MAG: hypothetical protein FH762_19665 [Firmicutes bacterium]|nr:hypothetical protein [Bacillota bacterium]
MQALAMKNISYREEELPLGIKGFAYKSSFGNWLVVINSNLDEVLKGKLLDKGKERIANGINQRCSIIDC